MTQILIDKEMKDRLLQSDFAEFVDEAGRVIGSFVSSRPRSYPPGVVPPMSDEERQRRLTEPGIYTTEQVFEHLRSL